MRTFELIDHTADIGFKVYGRTLKEVFENAARGMFALITDPKKVSAKKEFKVEVEAEDRETLLVEWLNELIYLFEVEHVVLKDFEITAWDEEHFLKGKARGEPIDEKLHEIGSAIKACSYHMLKVEPVDHKGWMAQVICDV
jgi:SHS2 domain-containing protein